MQDYAHDGYLVQPAVFGAAEIEHLRDATEAVATQVRTHAGRDGAGPEAVLADGHRVQFSSRAGIQWEWRDGSQEIRLIEPCVHLDDRLAALASDTRLTSITAECLGVPEVELFTSKLNFKRPREGSEFPWHQDFPYWYVVVGWNAADVCTAIVFLDDATETNGAIRVLPGSHRRGPAARDPDDPTRFLADPDRLPLEGERIVEVKAGDVLVFPALLVHRSAPNASDRQRRALLLSYQPRGRPRMQDLPFVAERVEALP